MGPRRLSASGARPAFWRGRLRQTPRGRNGGCVAIFRRGLGPLCIARQNSRAPAILRFAPVAARRDAVPPRMPLPVATKAARGAAQPHGDPRCATIFPAKTIWSSPA